MTEGGLIKTLFDFTLTSMTDYAHDTKFLQELEANGTNLDELFNKTINNNGTNAAVSEYDRRYNERYGYRPYGSYYSGGYNQYGSGYGGGLKF